MGEKTENQYFKKRGGEEYKFVGNYIHPAPALSPLNLRPANVIFNQSINHLLEDTEAVEEKAPPPPPVEEEQDNRDQFVNNNNIPFVEDIPVEGMVSADGKHKSHGKFRGLPICFLTHSTATASNYFHQRDNCIENDEIGL